MRVLTLAVLGLGFTLAAAASEPVACPRGTERRGDAPPDGFEQWCEGKDASGHGLREGPARVWYDDGGVWIERSFKAGEPDGAYVERHRNGKRAREGAYVRGRKIGTWRLWFESGQLEEETEWRDGSAHGGHTQYWPTGALRTQGRYCGGAQCGRWRSFDPTGKQVGEIEYGEQRLTP